MKITQEKQEQGEALYRDLVQKAWESSTFKEQLISNPEKIIGEVVGDNNFRSDANIVVDDQSDENIIFLNIPRKINFDNIELSDEQLETVSGGEVLATAGVVLGGAAIAATLFGTGVLIYEVTH